MIEELAGGHRSEGLQGSGTITKSRNITEMNRGIALTRNSTPEDSYDFQRSKNIYLGETRIATRLNMESDASTGYEEVNTYYYHPDHLGSSNIVTTPDGEVFEHLEYTPYGETWIEKTQDSELENMLPYRFTAKELDSETGLYYYGARYLNPRTSRWISSDPAGFELINPGQRDFSVSGSNWYAYTSNNPVNYTDPTGMEEDYTINIAALEKQDFKISHYEDNADNPITATFDGKSHTLGDDLNQGDSVPFDATFNVPEGSSLEIEGDRGSKFNMAGSGKVNLPEAVGGYNDYVSSDKFLKQMKNQKLLGKIEMAVGLGGFFLGAAAEKTTCVFGFFVMADGAHLYSQARNGIPAKPGEMLKQLLINK